MLPERSAVPRGPARIREIGPSDPRPEAQGERTMSNLKGTKTHEKGSRQPIHEEFLHDLEFESFEIEVHEWADPLQPRPGVRPIKAGCGKKKKTNGPAHSGLRSPVLLRVCALPEPWA